MMSYEKDFEFGQEQLEVIRLDLKIMELEKDIAELKRARIQQGEKIRRMLI